MTGKERKEDERIIVPGESELQQDLKEESDISLSTKIALNLIQALVYVYGFLTFPIYYAIQRPWIKTAAFKSIRAHPVHQDKGEVTYKPIEKTCKDLETFKAAGIETMDACFDHAVRLHGNKHMVGTRDILSEEEEVQRDGKVFLKWDMGKYRWMSYVQVDEASTHFGKGLRSLGLNPRERICIFAETKAEWLISSIGCFKQNFPLVTLYANLGDDAIAYGINQTEVSHVITSHDLLPKFKSVLSRTPSVKFLIYFNDQIHVTDKTGFKEDVSIYGFNEVLEMGKTHTCDIEKPERLDPAIIMYTSGSTGDPKGVVLPHEALVTTVKAFFFVVNPPKAGDIYLGYLPLAHILELLSEFTMIVQGIPVGYSSPNTMIDKSTKVKAGSKGDCSVLSPSLMCSVPLVIDRIYKGIQENINSKGELFKRMMNFFYRYKSHYRNKGIGTPILDAIIFRKMRNLVGGRIRLLLSGGAPLSPDIHDYVRNALSLPLVQGYGLTESCACGTIMDSDDNSTGRVGPPLQGVQVKLIDWEEGNYFVTDKPNPRGEIALGGGNIALGYFRLPEKTGEDFFNDSTGTRWFRTGDVGEIYPDGTLKIIDRKKDLVKLQFGEYVSLGKIESELKTSQLVENICIFGDSTKHFVVGLVVPDRNKLYAWSEKIFNEDFSKVPFDEFCNNPRIVAAVLKELCQHGRKAGLQKFELPKEITLCAELWTPESNLVTAAFKLKRRPIQEFYSSDIQRMYNS